jgi:uncharacterized damage-inducible protein DinB
MLELLRAAYAHDDWAMRKILDAADGIAPDDWTAPRGNGVRSLRDTIVHVTRTQLGYCLWWDGTMGALEAYGFTLNPEDYPGVPELRAEWDRVASRTQALLDGMRDGDERRVLSAELPNGGVFKLPLWQMMSHVAAHGVQHRAEAAMILSTLERSPGDLDQLFFFDPFRAGL